MRTASTPRRRTRTTSAHHRHRPASERLEGRQLLATISGSLFEDLNASGTYSSSDPSLPVAGVTVYLDQAHQGVYEAGDPTTTTDTSGNYSFTGLSAGTY